MRRRDTHRRAIRLPDTRRRLTRLMDTRLRATVIRRRATLQPTLSRPPSSRVTALPSWMDGNGIILLFLSQPGRFRLAMPTWGRRDPDRRRAVADPPHATVGAR